MLDHKPATEEEFAGYLAEIRELAEGPFDEMQKEIEHTNVFPEEFFELSRKHNLYRFYLPEQYGGWGLSTKQIFQVQEEFSRGPGGMRMHLHHAAGLNWRIMDDFGQADLKAWAMPRFADKTLYINFALTEAEAGSGADIKTSAVRDGDDWVINGEKTLISHTDCSDGTYLITLTDPAADKDHRLTAFFVPTDTPGYEIVEMEHMMGCRGAGHAGLRFTDCRVPDRYRLGEIGEGYHVAMFSLGLSRAHIADSNLGMAQRMLEISIARAKERVTFGKLLSSRQEIQHMIAESGTHIYALRQMVHDTAERYDRGEEADTFAAMCKLFSIRTVKLVSDNCLEILGGIGYFENCEYGPVERLYRDCRAMWLEEGPPTVQRITAARGLLASSGDTF
ncbi:MAG TPA: acyl-CoA dehydrogenase family protein [Cellulomonas sp.]